MTDQATDIETQFKNVYELMGSFGKGTKEIQDSLKTLQRTIKGAAKQAKTSKKKVQEKMSLSVDLEKFLCIQHGTKLTKAEVMKSVSEYIKTNNLQLEDNKRKFKPNKSMSKIFSMKTSDQLTFVEINKHVSGHLSK
jgi:chromatin remodeling complex protein RSC6